MINLNIIIIFISLLLDTKTSLFLSTVNNPSIFLTLYSVVALVVIYPSYQTESKFFYLAAVLGLLFDITFTGTFILNMCIFLLLAFIIKSLYFFLASSYINTVIISIITVNLYYAISYGILFLIGHNLRNINSLLTIILSSLIMTFIYSSILYFINKNLIDKWGLKLIK